jgi:peptidoglycan L-alanyl-D-glutamate endopeptidase CwlK
MVYRGTSMLVPELRELYYKFYNKVKLAGLDTSLTCTARELKDQIALYAQGRQDLKEVNELRRIAKLPPINDLENKKKVTWTLKSKHLINSDDQNPTNNLSRAFDIVILKDGKAIWDVKADINNDNIPDYQEAGQVGKSIGLKWGGDFPSPDYPHFEI